jgi:ketosteroid isomerase-like protein
MPWFPDFINAVELARVQTRAAGQADPVGQYLRALSTGDAQDLEDVWPGSVVIFDPRAGEIRGHKQVRQFVQRNQSWMEERGVRTDVVAATRADGRAVLELLAHLEMDGEDLAWPVAVVAECPNDRSVVFRTYCSQWPVDGRRHVRPPILEPGSAGPGDVVGRYHAALAAGDADAIVATFAPDGYLREFVGSHSAHRGTAELRSYFTQCFSAGGGIGLQYCAVTDDGVRCVLEYNCVRWGVHNLPPQAGLGVYERGPGGLLAAARVYDDVEVPVEQAQA